MKFKMTYFCLTDKKVYASLLWILLVSVTANAKLVPLTGEALLANFIRQYVQPYVESNANFTNKLASGNMRYRTHNDNELELFIEKVVVGLKPLLQDNTVEDDKLELEGHDETTIIEFIPKVKSTKTRNADKLVETKAQHFQDSIQQYKKLRSRIRKALKREKVTKSTKNLITQTLDKMIAQMIAHKCTWKDNMYRGILRDNGTDKGAAELASTWKKLWHKLKHQYKSKNVSSKLEETEIQKDIFLEKFQALISVMTNDLNTMVSKYKIVCQLESLKDKEHKNKTRYENNEGMNKQKNYTLSFSDENNNYNAYASDLRTATEKAVPNNGYGDKIPCTNLKICSDELKEFLLDFFIMLNDTALSAINNYAAMFLRDVSDDGYHEKERVVGLIKNIAKASEKKIKIIYKKETKKLKLDPDRNQYLNIKNLNSYITSTIDRVKKSIHKQIEEGLSSVREKLMFNIQKDVDVNMGLDLGNLERDLVGRICQVFEVCNGKVTSGRKANYFGNNKNNVYVKVQLNLEQDTESTRQETTTKESQTKYMQYRVIVTKSPLKFNVTRTIPYQMALRAASKTNGTAQPKRHKHKTHYDIITEANILQNISQTSQQSQDKPLKDEETQDVTVKITFIQNKDDEIKQNEPKSLEERPKVISFRAHSNEVKPAKIRLLNRNSGELTTATIKYLKRSSEEVKAPTVTSHKGNSEEVKLSTVKLHRGNSEEVKTTTVKSHDKVRSHKINSDKTFRDKVRSHEINSNEIKPHKNEGKRHKVKSYKINLDEVKPHKVKSHTDDSDEILVSKIKSDPENLDEVEVSKVKSPKLNPNALKTSKFKSHEVNTDEVDTFKVKSRQGDSDEVKPPKVKSHKVNSVEVKPHKHKKYHSRKKLKRSHMRNLRRIEFNRQMRLNLADKIRKNSNQISIKDKID